MPPMMAVNGGQGGQIDDDSRGARFGEQAELVTQARRGAHVETPGWSHDHDVIALDDVDLHSTRVSCLGAKRVPGAQRKYEIERCQPLGPRTRYRLPRS
jgi:hypothetical protein